MIPKIFLISSLRISFYRNYFMAITFFISTLQVIIQQEHLYFVIRFLHTRPSCNHILQPD